MLPKVFRGRILESVLLSIFLDVQFIYSFSWRNIQTKVMVIISDVDGNDNSNHLLNIYQTTYIVLIFFNWIISLNPLKNALR